MELRKKLRTTYIVLFALGVLVGYALSFAPDPLLHFLIYKDVGSELVGILIIVLIVMVLVPLFLEKRLFGITRKKVYRMLSIGISLSSFLLAFYTFLNYPSILASGGYGWLTGGIEWHLSGGVSMSAIAYFIAVILWDALIGSAFATLEQFLA
jgi:membrane protease YdiL (CAAX protease family)